MSVTVITYRKNSKSFLYNNFKILIKGKKISIENSRGKEIFFLFFNNSQDCH